MKNLNIPEIFGCDVFNEYVMKERLAPDIYSAWKQCVDNGIALELNTCGLRRWMGRTAGESWILETFRSFGGSRITIGSDAHFTRDVGAGVKETCALLRENGFDKVTIFRQRKPESVSI